MKIVLQILCIKVTCLLSSACSTNLSNSLSIFSLSFTIPLKRKCILPWQQNIIFWCFYPLNARGAQAQWTWRKIFENSKQGNHNSYCMCVHVHRENVCVQIFIYLSMLCQMFLLCLFSKEIKAHKWVNSCRTVREHSEIWKHQKADIDLWSLSALVSLLFEASVVLILSVVYIG